MVYPFLRGLTDIFPIRITPWSRSKQPGRPTPWRADAPASRSPSPTGACQATDKGWTGYVERWFMYFVYIYVYICIYVHVCIYIYTCIHMYVLVYENLCIYIYTYPFCMNDWMKPRW